MFLIISYPARRVMNLSHSDREKKATGLVGPATIPLPPERCHVVTVSYYLSQNTAAHRHLKKSHIYCDVAEESVFVMSLC